MSVSRRTFFKTASLGLTALALDPSLPRLARAASGNRLVVVGMDGVGLDVLQELLAAGRLPNLSSLVSRGCLLPLDSVGPTITVPNWTRLFTGLHPGYTGAHGNTPYNGQDLRGYTVKSWVWLRQLRSQETIFHPLRNAGHAVAWHVSKTFLDNKVQHSPFARRVNQEVDDYVCFDPHVRPDDYLERLTHRTRAFLQAQTGGFLAFHHQNQDFWGHQNGSRSPEFFAQVERGDFALGRILALQESLGFALIVVSDHGFDKPGPDSPPEGPHGHRHAPYQFLATDLPVNPHWYQGGAIMTDLTVTILAYFGLPSHHPDAWGRNLM